METERIIKKIEPMPSLAVLNLQKKRVLRVAAYARVSTDHEDQKNSLNAQKDYYSALITKRPDWIFSGIYTDEGISGLTTRKRIGLQKLLDDCYSGEIDLIITKSVSRFARNTVDTISIVRKLRASGIGVLFEKENLNTLDPKSEFVLTLMSSLAQEESRSISENIRWGQRKRFADGKSSLAYSRFLGYDRGKNKFEMVVNAAQAPIVRKIFYLYIQGKTAQKIAQILTEEGYPAPSGGEKWHKTTINSILRNEKYKGDALLQKQFISDYLTKRIKKNEGELPQYYVEGDHEAIVPPWLFDYVQDLFSERLQYGKTYSSKRPFCGKIKCGSCGSFLSPRYWHSKLVWECRQRVKRGEKCRMVAVYDKILYRVIHDAARKMIKKRKIIASVETALKSVVKKNKEEKIKNWLERFNQKAVEDLISDSEDISIIINMIYIYQNSVFVIRWIDGTETEFQTNLKEQSKGIYHGLKPAKNYQTNADSGNRI